MNSTMTQIGDGKREQRFFGCPKHSASQSTKIVCARCHDRPVVVVIFNEMFQDHDKLAPETISFLKSGNDTETTYSIVFSWCISSSSSLSSPTNCVCAFCTISHPSQTKNVATMSSSRTPSSSSPSTTSSIATSLKSSIQCWLICLMLLSTRIGVAVVQAQSTTVQLLPNNYNAQIRPNVGAG